MRGPGRSIRSVSADENIYYRHAGRLPFSAQLSLSVRRKMFELFMAELKPDAQTTVLDLGVSEEVNRFDSNYFERLYPYKNKLVCAGVEDASAIETVFPGTKFVRIQAHQPLPFSNQQFDIVFSNAVIEHAGSRADQQFFANECLRVAKHFFITTPNRWFPIEMHTGVPLLHFLPHRTYSAIFKKIGFEHWAQEENLNLLDRASLRAFFPPEKKMTVSSVRCLGVRSNLIAWG